MAAASTAAAGRNGRNQSGRDRGSDTADHRGPSLLRSVAGGWTSRHRAIRRCCASAGPDQISLVDGRVGRTRPLNSPRGSCRHEDTAVGGPWFMPVVPESRIAVLRTVLYLFVIIDIHLFVRDPVPLSRNPELYQPLMIERLFHLPPPSVPLTITLYLILVIGCLVAAANVWPRLAGCVVAAVFTWWTAIGMSYGKVDHDHLALVVALWVLPTVGVIADRWRSTERSAQAGWALKCIQISVIFTYFLSALTKIRSGG